MLLPFHDDLSIDEASFRTHLRDVAAVRGLSAITVNAHASEVASCTCDEQERVLAITMDEVGGKLPVVHGVYADGSLEAARIARRRSAAARRACSFFRRSRSRSGHSAGDGDRAFQDHRRRDRSAADLFQYPLADRLGYPVETLMQLFDAVPSIRAIKDWSQHAAQHERQIRALQTLPRPVNVLSTHSSWLLSSLVLGCNGLLSGSGSVIADLQAASLAAVKANDLARARS